ncbi:related to CYC2-cytochrome-c mitochondrial import factor [Ustilago bromivora]|uniref:Related to CYC2 - cytochrome-c mitochondrial import factor n=1 Tax=Ustilago bromivora TaxID=307758 RepID=A0A1K0GVK9_9BASI|nr:related to CYC2-cytochrome-c mitochondrial import factor [Ustilago bromivora]SYW77341.1 related to CYC2 - cytochrome-c mitochondrial import factor [Ustilago bromivora]
MLTPTHTTLRLSSIALRSFLPRIAVEKRAFARASRTLDTSYPRLQQNDSSSSSSGSSSSNKASSSPISTTNILIASAAIVIVTPYALDLYGKITSTSPSPSTSIPGKVEPYTHNPLPLISSAYYPDPSTASAHKFLQIGLPASTSKPSLASKFTNPEDDIRKKLRIRSIYIKEPSLVIERAYTPLYDTLPGSYAASLASASSSDRKLLDLIVKRYPDGELGRMLHRARPNPTVPQLEVRGPVDTWSFERDLAHGVLPVPERIVIVVGGTGVTPAYQLLTNLFGRPGAAGVGLGIKGNMPKVEVLYATQDLENALLLPQLHELASTNGDKISVKLFAERLPGATKLSKADAAALGQLVPAATGGSRGGSWIPFFSKRSSGDPKLELTAAQTAAKIPVYESRITQQHLSQILTPAEGSGRTLVLVSGPDGMVDALAGPKSRDGQTQGPLAGVLARIGLKQEDVFKL